NWPFGQPNVFDQVDRTSGVFAPWGTYNLGNLAQDEIYFASVRPGSFAAAQGFPVGNVYSSPGSPSGSIMELNSAGAVTANPFVSLGKDDAIRGFVRFDDANIANGDLVVGLSHDQPDPYVGTSTIYRIAYNGGVPTLTKLIDVDHHIEGVTFIPNTPAT